MEGKEVIIDKLIKDFRDKNIVVDKKRKDILEQDCKEKYISGSKKKNRNGEWLYRCTKDNLVLTPVSFGGGEELEESIVDCIEYEEDLWR